MSGVSLGSDLVAGSSQHILVTVLSIHHPIVLEVLTRSLWKKRAEIVHLGGSIH